MQSIKVREEANPMFSFLFELDSAEGVYYRWRTFGEQWLLLPSSQSRGRGLY